MTEDSYDEENNPSRLRQRLWGAAVLIAIAVIILPVVLDGAGSESQFRRVESLREEPQATPVNEPSELRTVQRIPELRSIDDVTPVDVIERVTADVTRPATSVAVQAERAVRKTLNKSSQGPLTAWVVQAGAFVKESQAIVLRDQLRSAGFASFVRDRDANTDPFRVLVGPMIKQSSAEQAKNRVATLLKNKPVIQSYP